MRNMSFALTSDQVLAQTKTVTRRLGWTFIKPGDLVQPVLKSRLRKGEKLHLLGGPIRITSVRREPLYFIQASDVPREGFPDMSPTVFVNLFCGHMGGDVEQAVTRIEFEYVTRLG